jgi:hypothetical protein
MPILIIRVSVSSLENEMAIETTRPNKAVIQIADELPEKRIIA